MTKDELMLKITKGERLTSDEDEICYALFSPNEYANIPEASRPVTPTTPETSQDCDDLAEIKKIVKGIAAAVSMNNHGGAAISDDDPVLIALQKVQRIFDTVDPVEFLDGQKYVEWMIAAQSVTTALDSYRPNSPKQAHTGAYRGKPVRCTTDGIEYASIATAARAYKVPATSISKHLSGRYGFATVHGHTFERITVETI